MLERRNFTKTEIDKILKNHMCILIDNREKPDKNTHITDYLEKKKIKYKRMTLNNGDYSVMIEACPEYGINVDTYFHHEIAIERKKDLEEISGNFSTARDRIEKEFSLYKGNMTLLIEGANYHDIINHNYTTSYVPKSFLGTLHSFCTRYNIALIFMPDNRFTGDYMSRRFYYFLRNILK
jgi:ERCC4-type nuclease